MNNKHKKTLADVFSDPISGNIEWARIEALFIAAGAQRFEGRGSRVSFALNGAIASFHRPHPEKEAKKYQVKDARDFLMNAGVKP